MGTGWFRELGGVVDCTLVDGCCRIPWYQSKFVSHDRKNSVNNAQEKGVTDERYVRPPGTYLGVYSGAGVATASPARPAAVVAGLVLIAFLNTNARIGCPLEAKNARRVAACASIFMKISKGSECKTKHPHRITSSEFVCGDNAFNSKEIEIERT